MNMTVLLEGGFLHAQLFANICIIFKVGTMKQMFGSMILASSYFPNKICILDLVFRLHKKATLALVKQGTL